MGVSPGWAASRGTRSRLPSLRRCPPGGRGLAPGHGLSPGPGPPPGTEIPPSPASVPGRPPSAADCPASAIRPPCSATRSAAIWALSSRIRAMLSGPPAVPVSRETGLGGGRTCAAGHPGTDPGRRWPGRAGPVTPGPRPGQVASVPWPRERCQGRAVPGIRPAKPGLSQLADCGRPGRCSRPGRRAPAAARRRSTGFLLFCRRVAPRGLGRPSQARHRRHHRDPLLPATCHRTILRPLQLRSCPSHASRADAGRARRRQAFPAGSNLPGHWVSPGPGGRGRGYAERPGTARRRGWPCPDHQASGHRHRGHRAAGPQAGAARR